MGYIIGSISDDGEIERGETEQGYVYKNSYAFDAREGICYIPELNDYPYSYGDILEICNNNEEIAQMVFDTIDWQSPETYYMDCINAGEVAECPNCNRSYLSYKVDKCPFCEYTKKAVGGK